ncbi:MAG TPA: hypothetical protein VM802_10085 [Chitinophaga sp.]|uniref:hypothetical protein n=1 Tax=Chitinophaga sp. TaxID=1869181 RepID=UPI002BDDCB0E|nr:hypothetical protein [Chitinophaga sp.]HVI45211.1 hypothetical protein [Chitinophaga sp.]
MEKSRSTSLNYIKMIFECNKIEYNNSINWDEFVSITFVKGINYVSITSIVYEDEINIEVDDQVNCLNLLKDDFIYSIENSLLKVNLQNVTFRSNLTFDDMDIKLPDNTDLSKLSSALKILTQVTE